MCCIDYLRLGSSTKWKVSLEVRDHDRKRCVKVRRLFHLRRPMAALPAVGKGKARPFVPKTSGLRLFNQTHAAVQRCDAIRFTPVKGGVQGAAAAASYSSYRS